jgi:hypothetical protein
MAKIAKKQPSRQQLAWRRKSVAGAKPAISLAWHIGIISQRRKRKYGISESHRKIANEYQHGMKSGINGGGENGVSKISGVK